MTDRIYDPDAWTDRGPVGPDRHARHARSQAPRTASGYSPPWMLLATGAVAGVAGFYAWQQYRQREAVPRLADDAPGRTARRSRFGDYVVTGRTVVIDRPRDELYRFVRDLANAHRFMANIEGVEVTGDDSATWTVKAPAGSTITVATHIVTDRPGEKIAWESTPESQIRAKGHVSFRDAPGDRGTEVEASVAYVPPMGELGRWIAKLFQAEPQVQGRRDLKQLKMLMETGEIATSSSRRPEGAPPPASSDLRSMAGGASRSSQAGAGTGSSEPTETGSTAPQTPSDSGIRPATTSPRGD